MAKNVTFKEGILQLAVQSALGSAATLSASTVLLIEDLAIQVMVSDEETLDLVTNDSLYKLTRKSNKRNVFGFTIPWIYSGTAGTASVLEALFLIGGFDSTVVASTSVTYTRAAIGAVDAATVKMLADDDGSNAYEYQGIDGRLQIGCNWEAGKVPRFPVSNLITSYVLPSSGSSVTPDYGNQKTNIGESWEGGVVYSAKLTVDGSAKNLCLESMSNDNLAGMEMVIVPHAGCSAGATPKNADSVYSVKYKLPDFASEFNPWDLDDKALAVEFGCGSAAGKKIKISCASVEVVGETKREEGADGTTYITQTFRCQTGNVIVEE